MDPVFAAASTNTTVSARDGRTPTFQIPLRREARWHATIADGVEFAATNQYASLTDELRTLRPNLPL
jgi:hypothetical protein